MSNSFTGKTPAETYTKIVQITNDNELLDGVGGEISPIFKAGATITGSVNVQGTIYQNGAPLNSVTGLWNLTNNKANIELEKLTEYIGQVQDGIPEVKYYDEDISSLKKDIEDVRGDIPEVPEVRYYEEDISFIQTRIDNIKKDIQSLPEVKYYEEDIESLKVHIQEVVDSIPVFPKWVNEVNEVPDFSWIGKTFSVIDDDFVKVQDNLNSIQDRITDEVSDIAESIEVKSFENKVDLNELTKNLEESKDKIYEELKEYSVRVWEHHNTFKDDDRKLKKQLLGENNKLKQKLEKDLKELNDTNIESPTFARVESALFDAIETDRISGGNTSWLT